MANEHMNGGSHLDGGPKPARKRRAATRPPSDEVWWSPSNRQLILAFAGIVSVLATAGWLTLPAKQSDLDGLKSALDALALQTQANGARIESLRVSVEAYREQVVRMVTIEEIRGAAPPLAATAPAPKPKRPVTARRPEPKPEPFLGGIFGGK